jgi:peptidoglycan hydrolase-like protein with peptidoglycan-binding domain
MSSTKAAGHRRRNLALFVVGASVASAAAGIVIGQQLQSPADAAAAAAAPEASRITVPVERRSLESRLIANGELQYDEPIPVRLTGSVGASAGSTQVVTKAPELNATVDEGMVLMEVSGRPVFVFRGDLPTYRSFEPGTTGPDVQQLEEALSRLGFDPGPVDTVYDDATEAALDALYLSAGYQSEGPTAEQRTRLRGAEKAVADAEAALTRANADVATAGKPISGAELLRQQQALQSARDAVPAAQATATRRNTDAATAVTAATTARDAAKTARDRARTARDAAIAAGAINPDTGVAYTSVEVRALEDDLAAKETALVEAEASLRRATSDRDTAAAEVAAAITSAQDALALAELTYAEAIAPKDVRTARDGVTAVQKQLDQARADLMIEQSQVGTKMPSGEMVFLPSLPTTLTEVAAVAGKAPADPAATASSTDSLIRGRISASDADLVRVGTEVAIELRDADVTTTGVVEKIEEPETGDGNGGGGGGGGGDQGDGQGRLTLVVRPDDPSVLKDFIGFGVRLTVTVSSTDGDVLAVPVAALSVGPDGESRVEVERAAGDGDGAVELVAVTVGLSAEGYAEITPVGGAILQEGDRVVVGSDTGRRSSGSDGSGDGSNSDEAEG